MCMNNPDFILTVPELDESELRYPLQWENGRPTAWRTWRVTNVERDISRPKSGFYFLLSDPCTLYEDGTWDELKDEEREAHVYWDDVRECLMYEGHECELYSQHGRRLFFGSVDDEETAA